MDDVIAAVDSFLAANQVDEEASQALRDAEPQVQKDVLGRGDLTTARNPSSVLLARLREAQTRLRDVGSSRWVRMRGLPFEATPDDVMRFFDGYGVVGDGVIMSLRDGGRASGDAFASFDSAELAADALTQRHRAEMGGRYIELFPASDHEAECASRGEWFDTYEKRPGGAPVREGFVGGGGPVQGFVGTGNLAADVEEFIAKSGVDDGMAKTLRESPQSIQMHVLERGDLGNARNPSAVLLSRIRAARQQEGDHRDGGGRDHGQHRGGDDRGGGDRGDRGGGGDRGGVWGGGDRGDRSDRHGGGGVPGDGYRGGGGGGQWQAPHPGRWEGRAPLAPLGGPPMGGPPLGGPPLGGPPLGAPPLGGPPPGPPGRLPLPGPPGGGGPPSVLVPLRLLDEMEDFVRANARGSRDTWAEELLARLGSLRHGPMDGRPPPPIGMPVGGGDYRSPQQDYRGEDDVVEAFFRENPGIDSNAADALRRCAPRTQRLVVEKGIRGARNPSSALLARIKDIQESLRSPSPDGRRGGGGGRYGPPGGGRLDNGSEDRRGGGGGRHGGPPGGGGRLAEQLEDFLRRYGVDDRAAAAFRRCDPKVQSEVMDKGLEGARNPSSALQARIRDAEAHMPRRDGPRGRSRSPRGGGRGGRP